MASMPGNGSHPPDYQYLKVQLERQILTQCVIRSRSWDFSFQYHRDYHTRSIYGSLSACLNVSRTWAAGWSIPSEVSSTTGRRACTLHAIGKESKRETPSGYFRLFTSARVGYPPPTEMTWCWSIPAFNILRDAAEFWTSQNWWIYVPISPQFLRHNPRDRIICRRTGVTIMGAWLISSCEVSLSMCYGVKICCLIGASVRSQHITGRD